MRKTYIYVLVVFVAVLLVINYCWMYIPFQPIAFDPTLHYNGYKNISVDSSFYSRLKTVLDRYGIEHYQKEGKVYIRRKDTWDKEIIWNYTNKALPNP